MGDDATNPQGGDPGQQPGGDQTTTDAGHDPKALANQVGFLTRKLQEAEKKLGSFEKAEADKKQAQMSELERANTEKAEALAKAEAAEKRAREVLIRSRFELAAGKLGAVDPDGAFRLADLSTVTVDEKGEVTGIDAALDALKTQRAYLFGASAPAKPPVGTGAGNPGGDSGRKALSSDDISRMSADEFRKLQADVHAGKVKL